jgi:hypothetical protein
MAYANVEKGAKSFSKKNLGDTEFFVSCVTQKTHSQQAMTKVKYVLVPNVK